MLNRKGIIQEAVHGENKCCLIEKVVPCSVQHISKYSLRLFAHTIKMKEAFDTNRKTCIVRFGAIQGIVDTLLCCLFVGGLIHGHSPLFGMLVSSELVRTYFIFFFFVFGLYILEGIWVADICIFHSCCIQYEILDRRQVVVALL